MSRRCCCCPFCGDTGGAAPTSVAARVTISLPNSPGGVKWQAVNGTYDLPWATFAGYSTCIWRYENTAIITVDANAIGLGSPICNTAWNTTRVISANLEVYSPHSMQLQLQSLPSLGSLTFTSSDCGATWAAAGGTTYCDGSSPVPTISLVFV